MLLCGYEPRAIWADVRRLLGRLARPGTLSTGSDNRGDQDLENVG